MTVDQNDPDMNIAITIQSESSASPTPPPTESFFASQKKYAEEVSEKAVSALDATRRRGDIWGKAVLSLGTSLITALGIGTVIDVFPVEDSGGRLAVVVMLIAFSAAVGGVIAVGLALTRINEPVVMEIDMERTYALHGQESRIVGKIYNRFATVNGTSTLERYARMGMAIERVKTELDSLPASSSGIDANTKSEIIEEFWKPRAKNPDERTAASAQFDRLVAELTNDATAKRATERAGMVRSEVRATMNSAAVALTRHRVVSSISSNLTKVGIFAIPLGLVVALVAADFAKANGVRRSTEIGENKACVELVEAAKKQGVTVDDNCTKIILPSPSDDAESTSVPVLDYDRQSRVAAWNSVLDGYSKCFNDTKVVDKAGICDPILNRGIG